ncbi:hypothetical protein [Oceanirhabdus sp. W0125-5]|nr:hypothetical protein [Oceanirhabdus sp. W0125-5]WBW98148.1 hypothetical protein OW730_05115 [Oceanirhabdus sp. W0125-5]
MRSFDVLAVSIILKQSIRGAKTKKSFEPKGKDFRVYYGYI